MFGGHFILLYIIELFCTTLLFCSVFCVLLLYYIICSHFILLYIIVFFCTTLLFCVLCSLLFCFVLFCSALLLLLLLNGWILITRGGFRIKDMSNVVHIDSKFVLRDQRGARRLDNFLKSSIIPTKRSFTNHTSKM